MNKSALRRLVKQQTKLLPKETLTAQSHAVADIIFRSEVYKHSQVVSVYISMPLGELPTTGIIQRLFQDGKNVVVPKVYGADRQDMIMVPVKSYEEFSTFKTNKWGIPEPDFDLANKATQACVSEIIDLVLVPGVAFDSKCRRLGHGKGYYDTFFQNMADACCRMHKKIPFKLGLALDQQIVAEVPTDQYDQPLDAVVSASVNFPSGAL